MKRRNFIKNTCMSCGMMAAGGSLLSLLSSCKSTSIFKIEAVNHLLTVPLSAMNDKKILIVRNASAEYDILLVKKSENHFTALEMKCTHRANPLNASDGGLYCTLHGSRFDLDGNVVAEPATQPLKKYPVIVNNSLIQISI